MHEFSASGKPQSYFVGSATTIEYFRIQIFEMSQKEISENTFLKSPHSIEVK